MRKLKVVGGFVIPDEKGKITLPPTQSLEIGISENQDWIEIPLKTRTHKKETER